MLTIPGIDPIFMWIGFLIIIAILLSLDLGIFNKKQHKISIKESLIWTAIWISLSLLFNLFIWLEFGHEAGIKFLAGYLLEKSLSVDNIFVIFLIFTSFRIEPKYQHRILFWGIIGAIILRGLLILLGTALIAKFYWIMYIFGIFLIYSGINMFFDRNEDFDPHESWIVKIIHKMVPVAKKHDGRFFKKINSRNAVTILFVTLMVIEFTDVVFAFDSIPAIFGITTDPFIVFTSNIFAILGLRSLYFAMAGMHDMFKFLKYGLAFIIIFIGIKMLVEEFIPISLGLSLGIVFFILSASIITSIVFGKNTRH
jgi:tellurite resistance protein TerC